VNGSCMLWVDSTLKPYFMLHQDSFDECLCQEEARNEKSRLTACGPFEYPPFIVIAFEA
jgi:hypothetical protein